MILRNRTQVSSRFRLIFVVLACVVAALFSGPGMAMTIEIIGGSATRIPIAIAPFLPATAKGEDLADVVNADLARSGLFTVVDDAGLGQPGDAQVVRHASWRGRGADALVVGQMEKQADGRLEVRFRLYDVVREKQLAGFSYRVPASMGRAVAHKIADLVHEKLTGEPGSFSGRMAYILKRAGRYELQVSDVDGYSPFTVANSPEPIISPAWSPDARKLAYVSFEQKKPVIYVQNLVDGSRVALANFRGSNSAPSWSPDGQRLAIVLSKDETSQIYLINADGSGLTRVSKGGALDTEPVFSPDGKWLYFTSDRGGSPQIYRALVSGGDVKRVTYNGSYNVSPAVSPDGSKMAYVHREGARYQVAIMELASAQVQVLTDTQQDESPTFSSNGKTILYATLVNGRGVLATVSSDGRIKQRLSQSGDLREPAWSP